MRAGASSMPQHPPATPACYQTVISNRASPHHYAMKDMVVPDLCVRDTCVFTVLCYTLVRP